MEGNVFQNGVIIIYIVINLLGCKHCQGTSCNDINLASSIVSPTGSYNINNGYGNFAKIYCQFYEGYGYAFISNTTSIQLNMSLLMDDRSHVIVRHKRTDGKQYTASIKQLDSFSHVPISVQFNSYDGYSGPWNTALSPYIYVGFIPKFDINKYDTNGWKINNESLTFKNCDGNENSYFTFLFNHDNVAYTRSSGVYSPLMFSWYSLATQIIDKETIPEEYFTSYFEIHHGGCGGYGTSGSVPDVTGVTVGVKFLIRCDIPDSISNGNHVYSDTNIGSNVEYSCDAGYSLVAGNLTRTCAVNGRWSGMSPVCKELVNAALGKQAFQSDTYCCGGGGAELAVDGGVSQDWSDGTCTLIESKTDVYWEVNLGNLYIIDHVTVLATIYGQVELYMGTARAFYNLVDYNTGVINHTYTFHMDLKTHARWVKIARSSSAQEQLSLCEVLVMGYQPDQLIYKERKQMIGTGNVLVVTSSVSRTDCCRKCFRYHGCVAVNLHLDTFMCSLLDSWSSASNKDTNIVFFEAYYMTT